MDKEKYVFFKKSDIIIYAALLALAAAVFAAVLVFYNKPGGAVQIYAGGELIKEMPLSVDGEFMFEKDGDRNVIAVENGRAFLKEASCPDQICVKSGRIYKEGQSIICIPHGIKIVIVAKSGE